MREARVFGKAYALFEKVLNPLQDVFLLVFRLTWGWQFFHGGWNKLANIDGIISYFSDLGIPAPGFNAYFVSTLETVGGLLLLLGLLSRFIALLLTVNMSVAYLTAEPQKVLHIFSDPDKFLQADPFFFLLTSVIVLAFGPGRIALDTLVRRWLAKRE